MLVREPKKPRVAECRAEWVTTDPEVIFKDEQVDLVVEVMGGETPAHSYLQRAIAAGKGVVSANKLLIAKHGPELVQSAISRRVDLAFEASVGGGIPIIRTLREAEEVLGLLRAQGLERGQNGLRVIMMCEIPSNAILAERFLEHFDGFSIGSNDMTQLTLGVDRDASGALAATFDERDDAVKAMLRMAISACRERGRYVGICGQGPSDHPDLAQWLVEQGIESISLNPDTVVSTWMMLANGSAR